MNESKVETYLVSRINAAGGIAVKTAALGIRGYFDRTVVLPGGRVVFCEVKKPKGGRVAVHQKALHQRFRALGAEVAVVKSFADVDRLVDVPAAGA